MASNDGSRLLVYGLSFRQWDGRKMQQILREYERSPATPNDRVALFTGLVELARELSGDDNEKIKGWVENGGEFPKIRGIERVEFGRGGGRDEGRDVEMDEARERRVQLRPRPRPRPSFNLHFMTPGHVLGEDGHDVTRHTPHLDAPVGGVDDAGFEDYLQGDHDHEDDESEDEEEDEQPQDELPAVGEMADEEFTQRPRHAFGETSNEPNHGNFETGGPIQNNRIKNEEAWSAAAELAQVDGHLGTLRETMTPEEREARRQALDRLRQHFIDEEILPASVFDETPEEREARNQFLEQHLLNQGFGTLDVEEEEDDQPNSPPTPQPFDPKKRDCLICMNVLSLELFPKGKISPLCVHDYVACLHCISEHIRFTVLEGAIYRLNCPICHEKLPRESIRLYAPDETFRRYEYLYITSNPDVVMCLGPNCGSGQIHADKTQPKMTCNTCGYVTCAYHKLPWHENLTCAEFDVDDSQIERLEAELATAKLLAGSTKICPACKQGITKTEGCDHLMCRCGQEWCFVCMESWYNVLRLGNEAHAPTCIYHPRKVQVNKSQIVANQSRMTELVHGGIITKEQERVRREKQEVRRREIKEMTVRAAEARRVETMGADEFKSKKRRINLKPAWEEK